MADVPGSLKDWSATASSNLPNDNTTIGSGLADNLGAIQAVVRGDLASKGSDIASSANPDVGAVQGLYHDITGNATIVGLGSTASAGIWKILQTDSSPVFKNSTALAMVGARDVTMGPGSVGIFMCEATNQWRNIALNHATSGAAVPVATTTERGVVELATSAEALTGSDTERAVTPSALESVLGMVKLATGTIGSATAVADITMTGYTAFAHKFLVADLLPATDAVALIMQVSTDGGTNYDNTANGYTDAAQLVDDAGAHTVQANTVAAGATGIALSYTAQIGNAATEGIATRVFMTNTTSATKWPRFSFESEWISADATPRVVDYTGSGTRRNAQDTDAVRLSFNSGNIASGTWTLYGFNT